MNSLLVRTIRLTHIIYMLHIRYKFSANSLIIRNIWSAAESGGKLLDVAGYTTKALRKYCDCFAFYLRMCGRIHLQSKFWAAQYPGNGKTALCGWLRTGADIARMISAYITNVTNVLRMPPNFIRKSFIIHPKPHWDIAFRQ